MLIESQKPKKLWLVGIFDNYAFDIGSSFKEEFIDYRKCIFDAGEWEIFYNTKFRKLSRRCLCLWDHTATSDNSPIAAGIIDKKLWLILFGYKTHSNHESDTFNISQWQIYSINLEIAKLESYEILNLHDFMEPHNNMFCIKCFNLQITSVSHQNNNNATTTKFMVAPNRIWMSIMGNVPFNWSNFYFEINETSKSCKFCDFGEAFIETKSVLCMHIKDNDRSVKMPYLKIRSGGRSYANFTIIDEFEPLSSSYQTFFRDQNGQICCLLKKLLDSNESNALVLIQFKFDYQQKTVRFENVKTFYSTSDIPYPSESSIFIDANIIVFQTETKLITVINRVLSLSELSYLTLLKISPPIKEKSLIRNLKSFFKKNQSIKFDQNVHGIWMSQKCLHNFFGVPSNLKISHFTT